MKKRLYIPTLLTLVIGLSTSSMPLLAQGPDSETVIRNIISSLNEGDIDSALELVSDHAVSVLTPPPPGSTGLIIGKEAFRERYENYIASNEVIEFTDFQTVGSTASWRALLWADNFRELGVAPIAFEGVGVVKNGLLQTYSWTMTDESKTRFQVAMKVAANKQLAQRYMEELWNQGNTDLIEELVHEEFVSYAFPTGGRDVLKGAIVGFHAENPGGHFEVDEVIVTEDRIVVRGGAVLIPEGADELQRVDKWLLSMAVQDGKIADRWIGFVPAPDEVVNDEVANDAADDASAVMASNDIVGVWRVLGVDFDFYHKFYPDGTFHAAGSPEALDDAPLAVGEYWIDDGQFFMKELQVVGIPPCGDKPAIYDIQRLASGNLKLAVVEDECEPRVDATAREHAPAP